jgi:hypothetical protein
MMSDFGRSIGDVDPDFLCALSNRFVDPVIDQRLVAHRP